MGVLIRLDLENIPAENRAQINSRFQQWLATWSTVTSEDKTEQRCTATLGPAHNILEYNVNLPGDIITPLLALHQAMYRLGVKVFVNCRPEKLIE